MGACASAGGAATSGQGMTGDQVAFAIKAGIAITGDHTNKVEGTGLPCEEAYSEVKTVSLRYEPGPEFQPKEGEESGPVDIDVTSYAPEVFRYLRNLDGVTDEQCTAEWDLDAANCQMDLGSGRSMALFMKSKNMDFMAKTIAEVEVNVLMDLLKHYTQHLTDNQNSLLMRFTMLYKVEIKSKNIVGFILCFGDLFSTCPRINELWDIKGRVPKPGKYLHFPKHESSATFHENASDPLGSAFDEANRKAEAKPKANGHKRTGSTIADADENQRDFSNAPLSPTSKKLVVRKDKDLSRLFWVPEDMRKDLVAQLHADYKLLADNGLMDYSILIGVKYNSPTPETNGSIAESEATPTSASLKRSLSRRKLAGESSGGELQIRPTGGRGSDAQHQSRCKYHDGVTSIGAQETYYIGVIDMLTVYNVKKKSANFFKTFLWAPETLSTIPPQDYVKRIDDFTDVIFPPLDPKDGDALQQQS